MGKRFFCILTAVAVFLPASFGIAGKEFAPEAKDKCAVCGMFVAKFPDWAAALEYQNGRRIWFDGVKDLMKGYGEPGRHGLPANTTVKTIWVKDYYSLRLIDGRSAYFVTGSNILGPMGKELIPFAKESDARGFLKDHAGEKILRFNQITPDQVRKLD